MLYELSRHPDVQRELLRELHSIDNPFRDIQSQDNLPASEVLERLPLLDAIIKESLRLRNTSPNLDTRVSPAHSTSRLGRIPNIPPGTRVGTYGWWLNRNPVVYPDPEAWNPHRWLLQVDDGLALRKWMFAFSAGGRDCIGQHIAMECKVLPFPDRWTTLTEHLGRGIPVLRMGLATIYTNYTTYISDESAYPGANKRMSATCTEKLFLRFERLST
jgi:cytochrome P450